MLDEVRRDDKKAISLQIRNKGQVFMPAAARRRAIGLMPCEEYRELLPLPDLILHACHYRPTQRTSQLYHIDMFRQAPPCNGERVNPLRLWHWLHQPQAQVTSAAHYDWAANRVGKFHFNVPKLMRVKTRSGSEGFGPFAFGLEGFALDTQVNNEIGRAHV
jgi:hypothetical protein